MLGFRCDIKAVVFGAYLVVVRSNILRLILELRPKILVFFSGNCIISLIMIEKFITARAKLLSNKKRGKINGY